MKAVYVKDFADGLYVDEVFIITDRLLRTTSRGDLFIRLQLGDRTGSTSAIIWNATKTMFDKLPAESFVRVRGRVATEPYQGGLQLNIQSYAPENEDKIDLVDFLPSTKKDIAELEKRLREHINSVEDKGFSQMLKAIFGDEAFWRKFCESPAAVSLHNAYLGGLLEHTVGVADLARDLTKRYPVLNADLLMCGALLHDMGKVFELSCGKSFKYTTQGKLLGHLIQATLIIDEQARKIPEISEERRSELVHLILSHHGEYAWGSPKLPMTAEAVALHYLDNLDAKLAAYEQIVANDPDRGSAWTPYSKMFDREMYKGSDFMGE